MENIGKKNNNAQEAEDDEKKLKISLFNRPLRPINAILRNRDRTTTTTTTTTSSSTTTTTQSTTSAPLGKNRDSKERPIKNSVKLGWLTC